MLKKPLIGDNEDRKCLLYDKCHSSLTILQNQAMKLQNMSFVTTFYVSSHLKFGTLEITAVI